MDNFVMWFLEYIILPVCMLLAIGGIVIFGFIVFDGITSLTKTEAYCKPLENKRPAEFTAKEHEQCFNYFHLTNNTYVRAGIH
jgi:hypothetical protein